jgi:hypothetical protein
MTIKVHFDGPVFVPDEPVDIPSGAEATVHLNPVESPRTDPGQKPISVLEWIADNVIEDADLPSDMPRNHDHYAHGAPKKP